MLKLIAYVSAKPGISREAFINHYEAHHAPLVRRLLPSIDGYRRNYVKPGMVPGRYKKPDYDSVTELTFKDQAALDEFWETISKPEVIEQIREDEEHFVDSTKTWMIGTEQYPD